MSFSIVNDTLTDCINLSPKLPHLSLMTNYGNKYSVLFPILEDDMVKGKMPLP